MSKIMIPPATQILEVGHFVGAGFAMLAAGNHGEALKFARARSMSAGVVGILEKAAIGPVVPPSRTAAVAFFASVGHFGIFDRLLADSAMRQAPMEAVLKVITVGFDATEHLLGAPIPLSSLSVDEGALPQRVAAVLTAMTKELATAVGAEGEALFSRELRAGVAKATDSIFLGELLAGAPAGSAPALPDAIANVVQALTTSSTSKVYLLLSPALARLAASAVSDSGMLYPLLGVGGGVIGSLPTLVSSELADGEVAALDADQIIANGGNIALDATKNADLQLTDTPVAGPQTMTSLWQTNSLSLRAIRSFAFAVLAGAGVPAAKCTITP